MKLHRALLIAALLGLCVAGAGTILASSPQQDTAPAPPTQRPAMPGAATQANPDALPMPVNEIIHRFAARESEFKIARDNYTYSQTVLVEASTPDGRNGGKYELGSDIVFTPAGKRYEKVTYAPQSTLQLIQLTPQDMKDLESIQPFVLTTAELPKYNVEFAGRERIDALDTYMFHVAPKRIEKDQRYFQGTIWVDDHDLAIVKSDGKAVPDILEKGRENRFPRFVTYRENIERDFWFPTYTRADDTLQFSTGDIRIRMTVRYRNYKRFGATVRVGESTEVKEPPSNTPPSPRP
ncbi:MAG TPA: hypothetical protein VIG89_03175 [Candidatus Acidoferrales bacterium]